MGKEEENEKNKEREGWMIKWERKKKMKNIKKRKDKSFNGKGKRKWKKERGWMND